MNTINLSAFNGKLVKFFYDGGTERGNRVVLVNETVGPLMSGIDMSKIRIENLKVVDGFRRYRLEKIVGNVEVIS